MHKYSIDASAVLDAWARYYPIDLFPSFWEKFKDFAKSQKDVATELIERELQKKDDGCHTWFKQSDLIETFFLPINDEVEAEAIDILTDSNYQRLVEDRKGTFGADPFVIALAKAYGLTVVTGERATNNIKKPKIPDVCKELKIECIK